MTPEEFKIRFPEFATESDVRIKFFIDDADPFFDPDFWGGLYSSGLANFVAHNLFTANQRLAPGGTSGVTSGAQTMKKVGDVQTQYDGNMLLAQSREPYLKTSYGQQYLYLLDLAGPGVLAV